MALRSCAWERITLTGLPFRELLKLLSCVDLLIGPYRRAGEVIFDNISGTYLIMLKLYSKVAFYKGCVKVVT